MSRETVDWLPRGCRPQHISFGKRLFSLAASNFAKVIGQIDLSAVDLPSTLFNRSIHLAFACICNVNVENRIAAKNRIMFWPPLNCG